jgi:hypothetical protein
MAVTQETPATSGPRAETPTTATGSTRRVRRRGEAMTGAAMVAPAVLLLIFFSIPVGLCFALAFTNARLISPEPAKIIGFENFTRLFSDPPFWKSLRNTFYCAVVVVPLAVGVCAAAGPAGQRQDPRGQLLPHPVLREPAADGHLQRGPGHRLAEQPDGGDAGHHVHVDLAGGRVPHGDLAVGGCRPSRGSCTRPRSWTAPASGSSSATSPGRG